MYFRNLSLFTLFIAGLYLSGTSIVLALDDKQFYVCSSNNPNTQDCSFSSSTAPNTPFERYSRTRHPKLHLQWWSELSPPPGNCPDLEINDFFLGRLFICGKWWAGDVRELEWNWLPQLPTPVTDNNTVAGWGSWTGTFESIEGFLFLRWESLNSGNSNCEPPCHGNPTASSGLPGDEPD